MLLVAILFGLAMEYEVLLVSRMRESYDATTMRRARPLGSGPARVVTAATIIMISVLGSFIFGVTITIATIGFTLAFGVLVDAGRSRSATEVRRWR